MDFSTFDLGKVKNMARKGIDRARQLAEGLNELEMKVEEATNNDKWGPHGSLMSGAQCHQRRVRAHAPAELPRFALQTRALELIWDVCGLYIAVSGSAARCQRHVDGRGGMQRSLSAHITARSTSKY